MLKQQLKNSKKAKYEMDNFCEQYGLPLIAPFMQKGKKKHDKVHKDYKYKRHFTKPNDFYAKKKNVYKKNDRQKSSKRNVVIVENMVTLVKTANKNLVN